MLAVCGVLDSVAATQFVSNRPVLKWLVHRLKRALTQPTGEQTMSKKAVPEKPDRTNIGRRNILKGVGAASAATALS
ncbi:MAG TPA: hypothetical protein DDZ73_17055, partial [Gammaproteobacteria bacterium]|nr:hypothetical protein [Gammaproteobacteria bacterium]